MSLIVAFVSLIFFYSLASGRLARSVVTAPIIFTAAGMVTFHFLTGMREKGIDFEVFQRVAEIGLVLLLFTDASRTDLSMLNRIRNLPARLLSVGMLLTIVLGAVCAKAVFRELSIWEAGILAAILAPTDAGLGQIIVNSPRVPAKIREALNVEAGLNDGLSVPFLLFFIALTGGGSESQDARLARFILEQLGYGAVVGLLIGLLGGWLLGVARRKDWIAESFLQLGVVALPLLCIFASDAAAASMFIAAFVAGLAVQIKFKEAGKHSVEFTEEWGQLFNLSVFFLFGLLVARAWEHFTWTHVLYAVLSLTVVRMLPVAVALAGTRLSRATVLFMGWFGPRGLASIVLGLVYLEHLNPETTNLLIPRTVMMTVLISIFAHGLSAMPGIRLYAGKVSGLAFDAPEMEQTESQTAHSISRPLPGSNH
jgi:sodium/hydrogen antiporter